MIEYITKHHITLLKTYPAPLVVSGSRKHTWLMLELACMMTWAFNCVLAKSHNVAMLRNVIARREESDENARPPTSLDRYVNEYEHRQLRSSDPSHFQTRTLPSLPPVTKQSYFETLHHAIVVTRASMCGESICALSFQLGTDVASPLHTFNDV